MDKTRLQVLSVKYIRELTQATEEQIKLCNMQTALQLEIGQVFSDLSVTQTIEKCLNLGYRAQAAKVRYDFGVSDMRFAHLELASLLHLEKWQDVEQFVKMYPRFPYQPLLDGLLRNDKIDSAIAYVDYLPRGTSLRREIRSYIEQWATS